MYIYMNMNILTILMSYTYFRCFVYWISSKAPRFHQAIDIIFAGYEGDWHDKDDTFELLGAHCKQWRGRSWLMLIDFQ